MQKPNSIIGIALGCFIGLLLWQGLFIALKLTHIIDWSWLWVFVPIWGSIGFIILSITLFFILTFICSVGQNE